MRGGSAFRRMRGLTVLGVILGFSIPAVLIVAITDHFDDLEVLALIVVAGSLYCAFDYFLGQRLLIDNDTLVDQRVLDAASVAIARRDVGSCRYMPVTVGRPPYFQVIEIRDTAGEKVIDIRRYGWGKRRRELFAALKTWIDGAGVDLDDRTQDFLTKAAE